MLGDVRGGPDVRAQFGERDRVAEAAQRDERGGEQVAGGRVGGGAPAVLADERVDDLPGGAPVRVAGVGGVRARASSAAPTRSCGPSPPSTAATMSRIAATGRSPTSRSALISRSRSRCAGPYSDRVALTAEPAGSSPCRM
ncbi:hypothetical protein BJF79_25180 [Actinomadura sp. CNU-125]|nr:hypothetical protein BJF79_25180 [Actinomadura sp. CNU-125]